MYNSNINKLFRNSEVSYSTMDPMDLLTPLRLDVVIKYLYAKHFLKGFIPKKILELYLSHIDIINGFYEADSPPKNGKSEFIEVFHILLRSKFRANDVMFPISNSGILLDGAHRLATALAKDIKQVNIARATDCKFSFDSNYFIKQGMDRSDLEYIIHQYCSMRETVKFCVLWPNAFHTDESFDIDTSLLGQVIYQKNLTLGKHALAGLVSELYKNESWVGNISNNYIGAYNKADWCGSQEKNQITVVFFEAIKGMNYIELKDRIRESLGYDKHSIHINDTHLETKQIADLILNENSLHRLNQHPFFENTDLTNKISKLKKTIERKNLQTDDFIILGSQMAAYGVGKSKDLDYFNHSKKDLELDDQSIELDLDKSIYFSNPIEEMMFDSKCYLYLEGFKMLSLDFAIQLRENRRRLSDPEEIVLLLNAKGNEDNKIHSKSLYFNWRFLANRTRIWIYKSRSKLRAYCKSVSG